MPPKRSSPHPRPYGRQAEGRTQKSVSLDLKLAEWAEHEATRSGLTFSAFIQSLLDDAKSSSVKEDTVPYMLSKGKRGRNVA